MRRELRGRESLARIEPCTANSFLLGPITKVKTRELRILKKGEISKYYIAPGAWMVGDRGFWIVGGEKAQDVADGKGWTRFAMSKQN